MPDAVTEDTLLDDLIGLAAATLSYCRDDSRSPRRRVAMISEAKRVLARAKGEGDAGNL